MKTVQNQTRNIRLFLLFPRTVSGETRWLEFVEISQRYVTWGGVFGSGGSGKWVDEWFIDKKKESR